MPRRHTAPLTGTTPGPMRRLEDELHTQWQRWRKQRVVEQEQRATRTRFERLREELTR